MDENPSVPAGALALREAQAATPQHGQLESDPALDNITASQVLAPGHYWTAKADCGRAKAGETLLLVDLIEFEGKIHSVELLDHPRRGTQRSRLLTQEFLDNFTPCPDAEPVRMREQQEVMARVADLQTELLQTQADPQRMIQAISAPVEKAIGEHERAQALESARSRAKDQTRQQDLRKTHRRAARRSEEAGNPLTTPRVGVGTTLTQLVSSGVNAAGVTALKETAERQVIIANAQATWLADKTKSITKTLEELTPYMAEKAQVALARSSGAIKQAESLRRGIESLDLYTGVGVDVFDVREGAGARSSEPMWIVQGRRWMEEELAVHADLSETFDWRSKEQFFNALASNDRLLDQVFPSQRCVVSMAVTRSVRRYENAFEAAMAEVQNQSTFLLVRNGDNVHAVYSATPSHEAAVRLFPSQDELAGVFRGFDGERVTLRDVDFGKHSKRFDDVALHYRRFLILLCGLDHRLKLFGEFYPPQEQLAFMSQAFQERYFRFYADDDHTHLLANREDVPVFDWIAQKNALTQSGSRIFIGNSTVAGRKSPEIQRRNALILDGQQLRSTVIVQREADRLVVSLETRDGSFRNQSGPTVKCYLDGKSADDSGALAPWWLCVDAIKAEEVTRYIQSRRHRSMGVGFLRLFKRVEAFLQAEEAQQAPAREWILQQMTEFGGVPRELALPAIDAAARNWRAARRGAALPGLDDMEGLTEVLELSVPAGFIPPAVDALLQEHIGRLSSQADGSVLMGTALPDGTPACEALRREPLLLTRSGRNRYVLYTTASALDRAAYPDLLQWGWVRRVALEPTPAGRSLKTATDGLVWLGKDIPASETLLRHWPATVPSAASAASETAGAAASAGEPDQHAISAWFNVHPEPIRLKKLAQLRANLPDAAADWAPILRAGPGAGMPEALFERMLTACATRHKQNRTQRIGHLWMGIPVAISTSGRQTISTTYYTARAERVLYTYGNEQQKARVADMLKRACWRDLNRTGFRGGLLA